MVGDSVPARGRDVVLAVPPHAAIVSLEPFTLENVSNQVRLVLKAAAKLVAIGCVKVTLKVEAAENPLRVDEGFCGAEEEARSRGAQLGKRLLHAVIDVGFKETFGRIPAAVDLKRLLGITFAIQRLGETSRAAAGR